METARCRAFLTAVEAGSFSRAAERLGYTPSGVSQLVAALEEELGFPLLLRSRRGVALTANGESLLPAVRELLGQEERIRQTAAEIRGLAVGSVTVAAYSSIATHWLPAVLRDFRAACPHIRVSLMEGIRQEVAGWLEERRADVGFLSDQGPLPWDWFPLAEDPMVAVLPRTHPLAEAAAYPLERCGEEDFIMPALGRDADVAALFSAQKIIPKIRFTTLENFAALAMIEQGLGMSVMNRLITRGWQCDVALLPLQPPRSITLGLAVPSLKDASPATRRFVSFAAERLTRGEDVWDPPPR